MILVFLRLFLYVVFHPSFISIFFWQKVLNEKFLVNDYKFQYTLVSGFVFVLLVYCLIRIFLLVSVDLCCFILVGLMRIQYCSQIVKYENCYKMVDSLWRCTEIDLCKFTSWSLVFLKAYVVHIFLKEPYLNVRIKVIAICQDN